MSELLVKEVSEVVSVFTTRYQKTREAREAKEPINFNCYNVELPISVVVHYPYGTLAADMREFHGLDKGTPIKSPNTVQKLNEVQIKHHANFQAVPTVRQAGAYVGTLPQVLEVLERFAAFLSHTWKMWELKPVTALKQGDKVITFVGDEPTICEVISPTKGIDKTACRVLAVGHTAWLKTTELYTR